MLIRFRLLIIAAAIFMLTPSCIFADELTVDTLAGSGEMGFLDGSAKDAMFNFPYGLCIDIDNNLLIVDSNNNRIRKLIGDQVVTVAGFSDENDSFGFTKGGFKDGEALTAKFDKPKDVVVDSSGNIFVTDTNNHVIRKISKDKVTTFAGTGTAGYADGIGPKAQFNYPIGLAIDKADNLYVADTLNHVIRIITPQGIVVTFAGKQNEDGGYQDGAKDKALFNEPSDIAIGPTGILYVADSGNQVIRGISESGVTTIAGTRNGSVPGTNYAQGGFDDGDPLRAQFNFPKGLFVAEDQTIFIADTWNHRIRAITPHQKVMTIAGLNISGKKDGNLEEALLNGPVHMLFDSGKLYVSDMWNNSIRVINIEQDVLKSQIQKISGQIQVLVNGKKILFPDVEPYLSEGKTMVPLRQICEEWGARVNWLDQERVIEVAKGTWKKELKYEKDPLVLHENRAMVHVRFLAEALGFSVEWIPETKVVEVYTADS
ncbi:MAG: stalk domain-containing protein [Bacillota bacterium]